MSRWLQSALWILAALPLLAGAAGAADVYLELTTVGNGRYTVDGRFWTPAEVVGAWTILSDYNHLSDFIPSLKESHLRENENDLVLYQEANAQALGVFHRRLHILLHLTERAGREIEFKDISHQDFEDYRGSWQIESAGGAGSWVIYHLEAKPNFFSPAVIARKAFRANARALLLSVQTEMERRNQLGDTHHCCS